jgi:hypothetical protein
MKLIKEVKEKNTPIPERSQNQKGCIYFAKGNGLPPLFLIFFFCIGA